MSIQALLKNYVLRLSINSPEARKQYWIFYFKSFRRNFKEKMSVQLAGYWMDMGATSYGCTPLIRNSCLPLGGIPTLVIGLALVAKVVVINMEEDLEKKLSKVAREYL